MKHLNDYTQEATTNLFNEMGAFFAFSEKQFNEAKKEGVKYTLIFSGMICPKDNAKTLLTKLAQITKDGIAQDIKENGKGGIIQRELYNHEAFYTGDIRSTVDALDSYNFTTDEIMSVFRTENAKQDHSF